MYIPNYDKYKDKDFWIGFAKVAVPIAFLTFVLMTMLSWFSPS